ncbi:MULTISPECIES: hypothetical protein [Methanoculleus]|nr:MULTISPECIES: hypothetical protein [Methanoculleus]
MAIDSFESAMIPDGNESARGLPYHRDDTTRNRLRRRYRPWFTCF